MPVPEFLLDIYYNWRYMAWPWAKCVWCGKRFRRTFLWTYFEEHCSAQCSHDEMDDVDAQYRERQGFLRKDVIDGT